MITMAYGLCRWGIPALTKYQPGVGRGPWRPELTATRAAGMGGYRAFHTTK